MSDLQSWLRDLSLEKYDEVMRANDIDLAVAADLTEQDLEKLGLSLGHRRRFLTAAAKLVQRQTRRSQHRRDRRLISRLPLRNAASSPWHSLTSSARRHSARNSIRKT